MFLSHYYIPKNTDITRKVSFQHNIFPWTVTRSVSLHVIHRLHEAKRDMFLLHEVHQIDKYRYVLLHNLLDKYNSYFRMTSLVSQSGLFFVVKVTALP